MSTFHPITGKVIDRDDLRSKQFSGKRTVPRSTIVDGSKVSEILHEDDGTVAGLSTEHPSGRVDGHAFPRPAASAVGVEI